MPNPNFEEAETLRLNELADYDLQDTNTDNDLDQLTVLIAQFYNCPIALITVINANFQWFIGKTGTTLNGNTIENSFCKYTFGKEEVFVVENTLEDSRFLNNPFVKGEFQIRFYAGAPIHSQEGYKLGTVCIYDTVPRKLTEKEKQTLLLFAQQVTKILHLKKINLLLKKRTEELITVKSKIFANLIKDEEKDKQEISMNLHEGFAQEIAATMMILKRTENNSKLNSTLIKQALHQLEEVLANMRKLSYKITPNIHDWIAPDELIKEYLEKISAAYPFTITVEKTGNAKNGDSNQILCVIRILDIWLKELSQKKEVTGVLIDVAYENQLTISIEDNGQFEPLQDLKNKVIENVIYDRVTMQGGTVVLAHSIHNLNILKFMLPYQVKK